MDHHHNPLPTTRSEAERLLGVAEKLLRNKDLTSSKEFAVLAQETEPLLEGPEQILAIIEVLLAAERRVSNNHHDCYAILQVAPRTEDFELIKKQYRRLALLLHPDKNKFPFSDSAFHLVSDAWAVLSDPGKKSSLDSELTTFFTKVDLVATKRNKEVPMHRQPGRPRNVSGNKSNAKLPVRRSSGGSGAGGFDGGVSGGAGGEKRANQSGEGGVGGGFTSGSFWTACPYCYNLYEYPKVYEGCCLKCQNCKRGFTAVGVVDLPPTVPGKEAYYCCWGVFPMGFMAGGKNADGFAQWVPSMHPVNGVANGGGGGGGGDVNNGNENVNANENTNVNVVPNANVNVDANANVNANANATPLTSEAPKKRGRGRPRKNP